MGIPTFFRSILKGNRRVIQGAREGVLRVDYFFMDFNSIIYKEWGSIPTETKTASHTTIEKLLITRVIERTIHMVNEIVRPSCMAYLSFDGPAPRAKMVQQRSRRFKSIQTSKFLEEQKRRLDGDVSDTQVHKGGGWDPSSHICPGTAFMDHLSKGLQKAMAQGRFKTSVVLSDSNHPGEGEHKILPKIRAMTQRSGDSQKTVVIYSPDGDMISLGLLTQKSSVYILRYADPMSEVENVLIEKGYELLYCSLDLVREDFFKQMTKTYRGEAVDASRILLDYNFLLAMVGNDFVPSLPFLKIRSGGLDILLDIYNRLRPGFKDYLVHGGNVHPEFFKALFLELSKMENAEMRKEYAMLVREYHGAENARREQTERSLSPVEVLESRYYHMSLFHPSHPMASTYRRYWNLVDYHKEKHVWKAQYYRHFCGFRPDSILLFNRDRTAMVQNYLESLLFTLRYYTEGCPSWSWHYRYRVAPIPSDVFSVLDKNMVRMDALRFEQGTPYTPFQQLMMILPPESMTMLPHGIASLASHKTWKSLYPETFEVDALAGIKYIYSEALLPENGNEQQFIEAIRAVEATLPPEIAARNKISNKVLKFVYTR